MIIIKKHVKLNKKLLDLSLDHIRSNLKIIAVHFRGDEIPSWKDYSDMALSSVSVKDFKECHIPEFSVYLLILCVCVFTHMCICPGACTHVVRGKFVRVVSVYHMRSGH